MNQFCTISTVSHLYKTQALAESLRKQGHPFLLNVLVTDSIGHFSSENCRYWKLSDIRGDECAQDIIDKYSNHKDKVRWSLKPVFLKHLLMLEGINKIIYLDNDIFFYSDYRFLFDFLDRHSFLLTPHYYKNDPKQDQNWLEANFRVGLFNAGFVGATASAVKTLQWWADCCYYRCEKNSFRGLFDDQKYLDLIPVIESNAFILSHKGCNVAGWNKELCPRETVNGQVLIAGEFPVVFVHYNDLTIREIVQGGDALLSPHYQTYLDELKRNKPNLKETDLLRDERWLNKVKLHIWRVLTQMGL